MMRKQIKLLLQSSQSGFTILECLMAIIVVGILMTAIAPVIAISVATRVQARRVETGTQAAKAYIDGVRSGAIAPPNSIRIIDEVDEANNNRFDPKRSGTTGFANFPVPSPSSLPTSTPCTGGGSGNRYCSNPVSTTPSTTAVSLYCIDLDTTPGCSNTSNKDMVVQAVRSVLPATIADSTDADKGYVLSVRVYRADAFRGTEALLKNSTNVNKRVTQGTAGGDIGLRTRKAPLVEMTTEVADKTGTTYKNFCDRFGGCK